MMIPAVLLGEVPSVRKGAKAIATRLNKGARLSDIEAEFEMVDFRDSSTLVVVTEACRPGVDEPIFWANGWFHELSGRWDALALREGIGAVTPVRDAVLEDALPRPWSALGVLFSNNLMTLIKRTNQAARLVRTIAPYLPEFEALGTRFSRGGYMEGSILRAVSPALMYASVALTADEELALSETERELVAELRHITKVGPFGPPR